MSESEAVNAGQFTANQIGESLVDAIYAGQHAAAVHLARRLAARAWEDGWQAGRDDDLCVNPFGLPEPL